MADQDHNRSNNTGEGAKTLDRDADTLPRGEADTPSQGGRSGGELRRNIASLDEEKTFREGHPEPTSVTKSMKPDDGADPRTANNDSSGVSERAPAGK